MMGRSCEWLARVIGEAPQQVWKYENGINSMRTSRLIQIAEALNVTVSFLFEGVERKSTSSTDVVNLLSDPQAVKLLRNFNNIEELELRVAVLQLAQTLARRYEGRSATPKSSLPPDDSQNADMVDMNEQ